MTLPPQPVLQILLLLYAAKLSDTDGTMGAFERVAPSAFGAVTRSTSSFGLSRVRKKGPGLRWNGVHQMVYSASDCTTRMLLGFDFFSWRYIYHLGELWLTRLSSFFFPVLNLEPPPFP